MADRSSPDIEDAIVFWYKNYKGEEGYRRAIPISIRYGTSDYHHSPQWLMLAFDTEKQAEREFAMSDMSHNCLGGDIKFALRDARSSAGSAEAATLRAALERADAGLTFAEIGLQMVVYPSDPETHASDIREYEISLAKVREVQPIVKAALSDDLAQTSPATADPKAPWRCINCGDNLQPALDHTAATVEAARTRALELADVIEGETSPVMYDILLDKPDREMIIAALRGDLAQPSSCPCGTGEDACPGPDGRPLCAAKEAPPQVQETEGELVVTQYELAAARTALREIANMSHNCRSVDIARAALSLPSTDRQNVVASDPSPEKIDPKPEPLL